MRKTIIIIVLIFVGKLYAQTTDYWVCNVGGLVCEPNGWTKPYWCFIGDTETVKFPSQLKAMDWGVIAHDDSIAEMFSNPSEWELLTFDLMSDINGHMMPLFEIGTRFIVHVKKNKKVLDIENEFYMLETAK